MKDVFVSCLCGIKMFCVMSLWHESDIGEGWEVAGNCELYDHDDTNDIRQRLVSYLGQAW
jgi:acetyltransferase-like isoleucine patch superfamily enzyme